MRMVRTNIEIDAEALGAAKRATGLKTAKEVVGFALRRLSTTRSVLRALGRLRGRVAFRPGYSYKRARG